MGTSLDYMAIISSSTLYLEHFSLANRPDKSKSSVETDSCLSWICRSLTDASHLLYHIISGPVIVRTRTIIAKFHIN